jgi:hypothetical protein
VPPQVLGQLGFPVSVRQVLGELPAEEIWHFSARPVRAEDCHLVDGRPFVFVDIRPQYPIVQSSIVPAEPGVTALGVDRQTLDLVPGLNYIGQEQPAECFAQKGRDPADHIHIQHVGILVDYQLLHPVVIIVRLSGRLAQVDDYGPAGKGVGHGVDLVQVVGDDDLCPAAGLPFKERDQPVMDLLGQPGALFRLGTVHGPEDHLEMLCFQLPPGITRWHQV